MKDKLFIIQKDPFDREIMSKILSDEYDITFGTDIEKSIEAIEKDYPQAIIYDMGLPDVISIRKLSNARANWAYQIPVTLIVSENSLEFEIFVRQKKINYYMIKPVDFRELEQVLDASIKFSQKEQEKNRSL